MYNIIWHNDKLFYKIFYQGSRLVIQNFGEGDIALYFCTFVCAFQQVPVACFHSPKLNGCYWVQILLWALSQSLKYCMSSLC